MVTTSVHIKNIYGEKYIYEKLHAFREALVTDYFSFRKRR
jgi:hypothetical protein